MSLKFTEAKLESAIIQLLGEQGYQHTVGAEINRANEEVVLIEADLRDYLAARYQCEQITAKEIDRIVDDLAALADGDVYENNKTFCKQLNNGFTFKRDDHHQQDIHLELIDTRTLAVKLAELFKAESLEPAAVAQSTGSDDCNIYKIVNQLEITGVDEQVRIPDGILYINGLPLVIMEFKSAIRGNDATLEDAWRQICVRYTRDIPQLFAYNAFTIISDGVNNKMGNAFAPYDFYYAWRKVTGNESNEKQGIDSLHTLINGLFQPTRLLDVLKNFIYFPDVSKSELKICCRYPQYYAARKLYFNIKKELKIIDANNTNIGGSGKGGTYFGATGCGKSFTMQFLARLLMKSVDFASPTIILITDRTDLDDQLSRQFTNAKDYIGDQTVVTVESRGDLREKLKGRNSGGVFLTTIHKFNEDIQLLSERSNIICISDEAHRSQINLDQKVTIDAESGTVKKTYGFAKYLHDSLPNATYVGFTGTPIDATLDVFGTTIDSYTMTESVNDEITVRLVYEGRAAKVVLDNSKLEEIEQYYKDCEAAGANEHQIEESKKASASMNAILGDPDRLAALAADFVEHYEHRVAEGSTIKGKAMFVCSSRVVAYDFYKQIKLLRPDWFVLKTAADGITLSEEEQKKILPSERIKMVMTRNKDDGKMQYNLLGDKAYRKTLDSQFKSNKSNFKIAIVVDMWLTGFDVPELDTIYIDKPLQKHNLIQTISRINRKYEGKDKGLVVDYIGIKSQMNLALAQYSKADEVNVEDIAASVTEVKNHLHLLSHIFHRFNSDDYFTGESLKQLNCLNRAAEFALVTKKRELRFMGLVKRLKAAYDVCCGSESLSQQERDWIHFYMAVRSIVFKLTKSVAPDTEQMNARVREMIAEALKSDGVEEIFKLGEDTAEAIDIFDPDYMDRISKIKRPNTKAQLLQKLLAKAIEAFKKVNQLQGVNFSKKFAALVEHYNERKENDELSGEEFEKFTDEMVGMISNLNTEMDSYLDMGIDYEEKAFYDILIFMSQKYDFTYPEDKLIELAQKMKVIVDDKAKYPDWSQRDDIKASLKVELIVLLHSYGFPPVICDEVYMGVLEQAENFKKHSVG